jgi:hypothetical protein
MKMGSCLRDPARMTLRVMETHDIARHEREAPEEKAPE